MDLSFPSLAEYNASKYYFYYLERERNREKERHEKHYLHMDKWRKMKYMLWANLQLCDVCCIAWGKYHCRIHEIRVFF